MFNGTLFSVNFNFVGNFSMGPFQVVTLFKIYPGCAEAFLNCQIVSNKYSKSFAPISFLQIVLETQENLIISTIHCC